MEVDAVYSGLYTASGSWSEAEYSLDRNDRLGELERDEGLEVILWTKAGSLVI